MTVALPSRAGGALTQEVGYLDASTSDVARWLQEGLGPNWLVRLAAWEDLSDAVQELAPSPVMSTYAVVPVGSWSLVLNNGPRGTDVGMLPSQAARELGGRGIRAVRVDDDEPGFPARILEVYGPDGDGPLKSIRSIVAANDGGEWVFETAGEPLKFERLDEYTRRRKSDRFTGTLLFDYLRELDVPVDTEPDWRSGVIVEQTER
jgi:hypothetical protein